jgi:hypothetical protein
MLLISSYIFLNTEILIHVTNIFFKYFQMGLYANPIFSEEGDYPEVVKDRVYANSQAEGFMRSRLPTFTDDEVNYIRGLWSLCFSLSLSYKY